MGRCLPWPVRKGTSPFACDSNTVFGARLCRHFAGSRGWRAWCWPDGGGQAWGGKRYAPLADSMTIWRQCAVMCWCLLTGIGSLRRSVTVPSRRLGGSASPLRRPDSGGAPIRIADSDPSGLFDALVPSVFQDMAERFPVISTAIYKSCQRKQERVGPLCLEPRRPNLRLSVDRGDGEVVSRTCRRQMTQGCIFATKMSSLVTEVVGCSWQGWSS